MVGFFYSFSFIPHQTHYKHHHSSREKTQSSCVYGSIEQILIPVVTWTLIAGMKKKFLGLGLLIAIREVVK
jgi:hypothetical protein